MKIMKSLFKTEIEFTPSEFREIRDSVPEHIAVGLFAWLKENIGLDVFPKK